MINIRNASPKHMKKTLQTAWIFDVDKLKTGLVRLEVSSELILHSLFSFSPSSFSISPIVIFAHSKNGA